MAKNRADSMRGSRAPWRPLISGSVANAALVEPALTITKPSANTFGTGNFRLARFVFAGGDTATENFNYQVVGWQRYKRPKTPRGTFWLPRILAYGLATLGTKVAGAAGADIESAAALIADTLTEGKGLAGTVCHTPADNTMAFLEINIGNCDLLEVEVDRGTNDTCSVIYQLADGIW